MSDYHSYFSNINLLSVCLSEIIVYKLQFMLVVTDR